MFRPKRPLKSKNQNAEQDSDGLAKKDLGYVFGPITDTGVLDTMYEAIVGGLSTGLFKTRKEAEKAIAANPNAFDPAHLDGKVEIREIARLSPNPPQRKRPREPFRTPTGKLTVPTGTFVYVYRRGEARVRSKPKGWFKYHLKKERTFQEHHQVTTMNQGLLRTMAVKVLSNKQWIVFHTEEEDYPLIAFSALTDEFPLEGTGGVHPLGGQPGEAFPFRTPLRYPPHGNTFERLFSEQKSAFLFKEGFKVGFESRKELDNK